MLMRLMTGRPERRYTIENPQIPLSDTAILQYLGGGTQSLAGVEVTPKAALGLAAYWRGVNILARGVAKLPIFAYKRLADGKEIDREHPGHRVMRRPSGEMTRFIFRQAIMLSALTRGTGYAYIVRGSGAEPTELIPLEYDRVHPDRAGGRLFYSVMVDGAPQPVLAENMLVIRGLSGDGIQGYSVVDCLREALGQAIATQRYGAAFFANNARPSIVLEHPGRLNEEAVKRLRESWMAVHGGPANSSKPAILEEGMKVHAFSLSNEDAQFIASRQESVREIANILGLPPHLLGDSSRTSYSSLEQENQSLLDNSFDPWLVTWEEELEEKLLTEDEKERDTHFFAFKRQALVRANMTERYNAYNTGFQNGFFSVDDIRSLEDMNPLPDDLGKVYYRPLNMEPLNPTPAMQAKMDADKQAQQQQMQEAEPPEDEEEGEDDEEPRSQLVSQVIEQQRRGLERDIACFTRRVVEHAKRAAKKPEKFHDWLERFLVEDNRQDFCERIGTKVATIAILTVGSTGTHTERAADTFFAFVRTEFNELTGRVTRDALPGGVEALAGDLERRMPLEFTTQLLQELASAN